MPTDLDLDLDSNVLKEFVEKQQAQVTGEGSDTGGSSEELETQITTLLEKDEAELTDEEKKVLKENEEIVNKLQEGDDDGDGTGEGTGEGEGEGKGEGEGGEPGILEALMIEEGYVEEGEYEDSSDGIKQYIADRDKKRDLKVLEGFLSANEQMAAVFNHIVVQKKPLESLLRSSQKPAILETQLLETSATSTDEQKEQAVKQHSDIIRQGLKGKFSDSIVEQMITSAVEKGETLATARDVLKDIEKQHNADVASIEAQARTEAEALEKQEEEIRKNIQKVITKGEAASNIIIPQSDRVGLYEFLTKPVDALNNRTKQQIVSDTLSDEENILIDYLLYLKAKNGKIDLALLKSRSAKKKFFKKSKEENEDRQNRGTGNSNRSDQDTLDILKSIRLQ